MVCVSFHTYTAEQLTDAAACIKEHSAAGQLTTLLKIQQYSCGTVKEQHHVIKASGTALLRDNRKAAQCHLSHSVMNKKPRTCCLRKAATHTCARV